MRDPDRSATFTLDPASPPISWAERRGALRELADLGRDDGEAPPVLARARRLDGRVEREEVRLVGDLLDDGKRRAALEAVKAAARELGFEVTGEAESPIEGPAGNREWLLALRLPG